MSKSFPPPLALIASATLMLSACSSMPSGAPIDTTPLQAPPPECLKACGSMPEPSGRSEAEMMRWELQAVQWGERCLTINRECRKALVP